MSLRRKSISKPHFIDDINKVVYVAVSSWAESMSVRAMVAKYYPGYRATISTVPVINSMIMASKV